MTTELQTLRASNDAFDDPAELRARMEGEGYLFIKRLFSPDEVLALRKDMLTVIQASGWLMADTDPMDGIADVSKKCTEGDPGYPEVYHKVYSLQSFHEAGHWPAVLDVMGKIVNGPVFAHPTKIARIWFPQFTEHTTPVHQDFVHFQGSFDTYTCWAPVGECPIELGGLAVLPRSHRVGKVLDHKFSLGAGSLMVDATEQNGEWHSIDYEPGDALLFHSLTLHRALPNVTEDRLRVSLDNRYQSNLDPVAEHMLQPHLQGDPPLVSWDEIYAAWTDTKLQHYWLDRDGPVLPRDNTYGDQGFADAIDRARQGEAHAVLQLQRIVSNSPNSERGREAARVLQEAL
jgi:hypothetical protein